MSVPATSAPKARLRWALAYPDGSLVGSDSPRRHFDYPAIFTTRASARKWAKEIRNTARPIRIEITAGWRVRP